MIPNREGWHYLVMKNCIIKRIKSKHDGGFYCFNWLHSFRTKNKFKLHKKVCENKDLVRPFEDTNVLEFNQYQKFDKAPSIIYAVRESLIKKNRWM